MIELTIEEMGDKNELGTCAKCVTVLVCLHMHPVTFYVSCELCNQCSALQAGSRGLWVAKVTVNQP